MQLPDCPNSRPTTGYRKCPRPRTILLQETETVYQFGCDACKCAWVVSKPQERDRGQYTAAIQRQRIRTLEQSEYARRRQYFDIRRSA